MRLCSHIVATLMLAVSLSGCGTSEALTSNPGPPPPHGGDIVNFRNDSGVVEIVKKPVSKPKEVVDAEVAFYFYKEPFTPFPTPTSGSLVVTKKKIPLRLSGDALVTPPGPALFARSAVDGTLSVEIDGKTIKIPLGDR